MNASHDAPTVSVVVPTYYRNDRLRDAIESVCQQTHEGVELIVVDATGEDHAGSVVADYDLTYVESAREEEANPARTRGIQRATGEYVQLLDDDDRLHETKLQRHVELLERTADAGVAYCGMTYEGGETVLPDPAVRGEVLEAALRFGLSPCLTSTMLIETGLLREVCPLADRPGGDDLGLMIELARRSEFEYIEESLVVRGVIENSRGNSLGEVRGRKQLLSEYDDLYQEFTPEIKAEAYSSTSQLEGRIRLRRAGWSPAAIRAFALACYHTPSPETAALLGASLLGRPGIELLHHLYYAITP